MELETLDVWVCELTGEVLRIPVGQKKIDVIDDNTEEWEDVLDRGQYWWEND